MLPLACAYPCAHPPASLIVDCFLSLSGLEAEEEGKILEITRKYGKVGGMLVLYLWPS